MHLHALAGPEGGLRPDAEQLVEALGMHKTTYTNYEQGKPEIPFVLVIRLANYYNVSINYIAGIDKRPTPSTPTPLPLAGRQMTSGGRGGGVFM